MRNIENTELTWRERLVMLYAITLAAPLFLAVGIGAVAVRNTGSWIMFVNGMTVSGVGMFTGGRAIMGDRGYLDVFKETWSFVKRGYGTVLFG